MTTSNEPAAGRPDSDRHRPVMLERCLELLTPALQGADPVLVDCTLGLGGHSAALLATCPSLHLVGLDRDREALDLAAKRLAGYRDRTTLVHAVHSELPEVLARLGLPRVRGVLFDLGVSSLQLDESDRGFSYARDAPLDMRMDQSIGVSAAEVLNTYPPGELVRILRTWGEEKFARRIVAEVVRTREQEPLHTSAQLVAVVRKALPQAAMRRGGNPAKRTFQALRIEVNGEMAALERALPAAVGALAVGGRIVVLSYHSLEDRLVKRVLADGARTTAPPGLPVVPEQYRPRLQLLTRGAEVPTDEEVAANRRAAPARLRGAERIREHP